MIPPEEFEAFERLMLDAGRIAFDIFLALVFAAAVLCVVEVCFG